MGLLITVQAKDYIELRNPAGEFLGKLYISKQKGKLRLYIDGIPGYKFQVKREENGTRTSPTNG